MSNHLMGLVGAGCGMPYVVFSETRDGICQFTWEIALSFDGNR